jgi:replicative DNA helicase
MTEAFTNPELEPYVILAQEMFRRIYAEETPNDLNAWCQSQLQKLAGAKDENARLLWADSFTLYADLIAKREALAALPERDRHLLTWPWASWNAFLDPLEAGMLAVIAAGDGMGKCLGRGTKVMMFDGSLRAVENVAVGDNLMGPDSKPRRVLALGRGQDQMYTIHQNSGITYRANGAHILALIETDRKGKRTRVEMTVEEVNKRPSWYVKRRLHGYKTPIDFDEQSISLPAYFMGYWLGDGSSRSSAVYTAEPEVIAYLEEYAAAIGCKLEVTPEKRGGNVTKCCVSVGRGGGGTRRAHTPGCLLGKMGLLRNWKEDESSKTHKRIPQEYISNSQAVRLDLLAGLIDSDGHYDDSACCYEIVQKEEALAREIKVVADSLGFATTLTQKMATIKSRGVSVPVWRLRVSGDIERVPCMVERKKARSRRINKDWRVTGIRIEPDKIDEFFGFRIDGDGLFLLEDMTVTHNTIYAECLAEHWARQGNAVAFLHFELNRGIMLDRRMARHTGIARRTLKAGTLTNQEKVEMARADDLMRSWQGQITYVHTPGWTVERALTEIRAMMNEGLCDVFIVDYLEKAAASAKQAKQYGPQVYEREADDVEQIKNFSEAVGIPVVILSQLNKLGKGQRFADLDRTAIRGSGAKTEKANVVALLHRDSPESEQVRVKLDKNTIGAPGTMKQIMDAPRFRVFDVVD